MAAFLVIQLESAICAADLVYHYSKYRSMLVELYYLLLDK